MRPTSGVLLRGADRRYRLGKSTQISLGRATYGGNSAASKCGRRTRQSGGDSFGKNHRQFELHGWDTRVGVCLKTSRPNDCSHQSRFLGKSQSRIAERTSLLFGSRRFGTRLICRLNSPQSYWHSSLQSGCWSVTVGRPCIPPLMISPRLFLVAGALENPKASC